jgi:hypothetical protein
MSKHVVCLEDAHRARALRAVVVAPARQGILRWWIAAPMLLALAGGALAIVHFREQAPERAVVRFQIPIETSFSFRIRASLRPRTRARDGRGLRPAGGCGELLKQGL